jgi:RNA polymerase primary sigma factor
MIAGLCESPLTFQAIIIWRDELNEGKVFLRDIIDLEATYAGPDAKAMPGPVAERISFVIAASDRSSGRGSGPSVSGIPSFCGVSSVLLAMSLTAGTEPAPDRGPLA